MPYFGSLIGHIIVSFFSDNRGRKKALIISWALTVFGLIIAVASPNIILASIGIFFAGLGSDSGGTSISFLFMAEVFENNLRQKSMVGIQACFPIAGMLSTLFYYLYGDWWIATFYIVLIPAVITLISMIIFLE